MTDDTSETGEATKATAKATTKRAPAKKTALKKTAPKKTAAKKAAVEQGTGDDGSFSSEERAAIKQAAAEKRRTAKGKNTEQDVLDALAAMDDHDRVIGEGLHRLVKEVAPDISSRTWYGFPAYGNGKDVIFFYQFAGKFKSRYGHIGFNDGAQLDDGSMWATAYAITEWNDENEARVRDLILRALGQSE
ncbi:iron chaperone [Aestuariimicrobium sp. Y1814]|uniref:iron chaperone n=1 Tax=Aestuariimicrobium sp. Y1814 TaxID=3418742 RepID=UPI003DA6F52A